MNSDVIRDVLLNFELLLIVIALRTFALIVITPVWHYSLMKAIDRTLTYVKLPRKPFKPGFRTLAIHDCG